MHTPQLFSDILIIILAALPVVYLCFRLKLPVLVGLMLAGIAIGPYSFGLITDLEGVEVLAEVGVMLLLFTIGLEFSLSRLREMGRLVLIGGGLQVLGTIAATASISYFLGRELNQSIFFGFLVALSSTAIVLKSYVDRNEVDSPHGKVGVGILLFQDICIVLMLLMVPLLAGSSGETSSVSAALIQLSISLVVLVSVVLASWYLIPILLRQVVTLRSPEVFILSVVLIALGMSWVTSQLGLSLALGAFIAGVILADSEYNHQAISEVLPFRDVFNSLFFVSIGMLLSISILLANIEIVLELIAAIIIGKALLVWAVVRLLGYPQRVSAMAALGLAQVGEFSFVLARSGRGAGLLPDAEYQSFLAASILSMIATPFLIAAAPRFGFWIQSVLKDGPRHNVENAEDADIHLTSSGGLQQHVVIVGYGLNGRNLARVLRTVGVPYCVLDLNADAVKRGKAKGEKINFGDATRREVLQHANIDSASALVLAMSDPHAARRTVGQARALNSDVHIIVRTRYVSEITELYHLGADEVIPEEFETSIEIFARVLHRFGFARNVIELQIENVRKQGYEMLRSPSPLPAKPGTLIEALDPADTTTVTIPDDSPVIGKGLGALDIRGKTGVTVIAVLRKGETKISPGANYILQPGDTVVLLGAPDRMEEALKIFQSENEERNSEGIGGFNP